MGRDRGSRDMAGAKMKLLHKMPWVTRASNLLRSGTTSQTRGI